MRNPGRETTFHFKQFDVSNCLSAMKVGTDGVLLGAWAFREGIAGGTTVTPGRILDVGCGTGLISLMMAQRFPEAHITGIDIDAIAAEEALTNFKKSPWPGRLNVISGDFNRIYAPSASESKDGQPRRPDCIVSNPPFFSNGGLSHDAARNIARHDSTLSLEMLFSTSAGILESGGRLAAIFPAEHLDRIKFQSVLNGFEIARLCMLHTTPQKAPRRVLCELVKGFASHSGASCSTEHLHIRLATGEYSDEYIRLVSPFYTKI